MLTLMQKSLRSTRLATRIVLLLVLSAGVSALLAVCTVMAIAWYNAESHARQDLQQTSRSLAYSIAAPLAFEDAAGLTEALSILGTQPGIIAGWIQRNDGHIVRSYGRAISAPPARDGGSLWDGYIEGAVPILVGGDGEQIGTLTLRMNLAGEQAELRREAMFAAGAGVLALLLAVLASQRFARRISIPVANLALAARALSTDWKLRERLPEAGDDEVGVAVRAFNAMAVELERRDATLQGLNAQLRRTADEAEQARSQAEAASGAKSRFLANMSHELRSPLNGVIGAAQLLEQAGSDPQRRAELVRIIRTSGHNLLDLIESVLDVSRIEAGKVRVEMTAFDLFECVESALAPATAMVAGRPIQLNCWLSPQLPHWCRGDGKRVKQLLMNLLGNAVKFTARGEVVLEVSPCGDGNGIEFIVSDTGIGIAPEMLGTVFEPFRQVDASSTRRFGGSGLGLTICREVAQLMGGEISVESILHQGSRFVLRLPLDAIQGSRQQLQERQVLYFESQPLNRMALEALLDREVSKPVCVMDPADIPATLALATTGEKLTVFMAAEDPRVPAVLRQLKLHWPDVQLVGIGTSTSVLDQTAFETCISRPVTYSALHAVLHAEGNPVAESSAATILSAQAPQVLVVEDDEINRMIVRSMVEQAGMICTVAPDGSEALRLLAVQRFSAVLMDWQMPGMDGLEVTRGLRLGVAGELNRSVPVLALTANAFAEDRDACLAAGMNDFMTKPVQTGQLAAILRRWVRSPAAGQDTLAPADYDPSILAALPMVVDGSNPGYVQELLALFIDSAQRAAAALKVHVEARDAGAACRVLHALKSSAGQVGALALSTCATQFEAQLRRGEELTPEQQAAIADAVNRFERLALESPGSNAVLADSVAEFMPAARGDAL
jgi:signal transduction histidine kinase/CheY-like chemotaxis protein/HPt (histidine-containing phosphotransfer) domain-containing protein